MERNGRRLYTSKPVMPFHGRTDFQDFASISIEIS